MRKHYTKNLLAFVMSCGFLAIIAVLMFVHLSDVQINILTIMLGTLSAIVTTIFKHYFDGTSVTEKEKSQGA